MNQLFSCVDIRTWHANIEQHASEGVNKILIGNKSDWTDKRAVTEEEGRELAEELGIKFIETSAKVNEGVEDAFFTLARYVNLDSFRRFHPYIDAVLSRLVTSRPASLTRTQMVLIHLPLRPPNRSMLANRLRPRWATAAHRMDPPASTPHFHPFFF
jgi:Fe2+ transport system protein B